MNTAAILAELQRPLSPADGTPRSRRMLAFPLTGGDGLIREWTLAQWRSEDVGVLPAQRFRAEPALPRQQYTIDEARGQEEELALSHLRWQPIEKLIPIQGSRDFAPPCGILFAGHSSPLRTSASSAPIQEPKIAPSTLTSKKGSVKQPKKSAEPLPALTTRAETITNSTTPPTSPASAAERRWPTQAVGESTPAATPNSKADCIKIKISCACAGASFSGACSKSNTNRPTPVPANPAPSVQSQSRPLLRPLLVVPCGDDFIVSFSLPVARLRQSEDTKRAQRLASSFYLTYGVSRARSRGKSVTSFTLGMPVSSISSRSRPMPQPPCGGMP